MGSDAPTVEVPEGLGSEPLARGGAVRSESMASAHWGATRGQPRRLILSTQETDVRDPTRPDQPHDRPHSPVVLHHLRKRADDWQLRLADRITVFAGSMRFVWVHIALFAFWIASGLFGADRYPFQFLTFVVSLEAIFLSTFVLIAQNRQSAFQQAKADHDFHEAETELKSNTELTRSILRTTQQINAMTAEIHATAAELRRSIASDDPPPAVP